MERKWLPPKSTRKCVDTQTLTQKRLHNKFHDRETSCGKTWKGRKMQKFRGLQKIGRSLPSRATTRSFENPRLRLSFPFMSNCNSLSMCRAGWTCKLSRYGSPRWKFSASAIFEFLLCVDLLLWIPQFCLAGYNILRSRMFGFQRKGALWCLKESMFHLLQDSMLRYRSSKIQNGYARWNK